MKFEIREISFQGFDLTLGFLQGWEAQWDPSQDYEKELALLSPGSFLKRKQDFTAGRLCAQHVLRSKKLPCSGFLPRHESGPAIFPDEVCGAISHTTGQAVAMISHKANFQSVGVDIEIPMPAEVWGKIQHTILSQDEESLLKASSTGPMEHLGTLVFSAKETLYKAFNPLVKFFFGFDDFRCVEIDFTRGLLHFLPQGKLQKTLGSELVAVGFELRENQVLTFTGVINSAKIRS